MHRSAVGLTREEMVNQVKENEKSVHDYASYVPIKDAVKKLKTWQNQGAEILYLTSRTKPNEIEDVKNVLKNFGFPDGQLLFRRKEEEYNEKWENFDRNNTSDNTFTVESDDEISDEDLSDDESIETIDDKKPLNEFLRE